MLTKYPLWLGIERWQNEAGYAETGIVGEARWTEVKECDGVDERVEMVAS